MLKFIANQFKKPQGFAGKIVSNMMEKGNLKTYEWMLSLMNINPDDKIFEIGYGTGFVINRILEKNRNISLHGIDFSKVMFEKAEKKNKQYIKEKKVFLKYGDLLDYDENNDFNKIYGINVIYFWNDLEIYFSKIYKLLSKKGRLFLYMTDAENLLKIKFSQTDVFNKYTPVVVTDTLKSTGFINTNCLTGKINMKKAYCIIAEK
jgi:cyclopropane fatty-acyl-phospholipid synthase-like methyltransferase